MIPLGSGGGVFSEIRELLQQISVQLGGQQIVVSVDGQAIATASRSGTNRWNVANQGAIPTVGGL